MKQKNSIAIGMLILAGCVSPPDVIRTDFTKNAGAYIIGYTTDSGIRRAMEDQLVQDLEDRQMIAYPSYPDLPDIRLATRKNVLSAALAKKTVAVVVINQVVAGEDGVIDNPIRISPHHPDLRAFYDYTRTLEDNPEPDGEVFAEVNAFLIDGDKTRLVWSGTTWSFQADGAGGAISGISETIASEMGKIRDKMRTY
ncbi:MAG: hypothetical protein O7G86_16640 [Gammaproteobacteria bacterium]|nr:hypothetical protein [Gammaproteobacteria bacterium]